MRRLPDKDAAGIIDRIKSHGALYGLPDSATVGVLSAWDSKAAVDQEDGKNDIIITMTTDDVDLDEEVVLPWGGDLSAYLNQNRKVFVDHYYTVENCAGAIRWVKPFPDPASPKGLRMRMSVLKTTNNPLPGLCLDMARQCGIGASIGFEALDWGKPTAEEAARYPAAKSIVRKWRAIEVSLTCLPCNVTCQGVAVADESKSAKVFRVLGDAGAKRFRVEAPRKVFVVRGE